MTTAFKLLALTTACAVLAGCATSSKTGKAEAPAEPVVLENTSWMLPPPEKSECDTPPVIEFLPDNKLSGDLGCNRAAGSFEFDGHNILFDKVATTRRMCGPAFMALEDEMTKILREARTVKLTDKGLTFFDAQGKAINTLVPELAGACY